ncbi:MAG: PilZ domain-containing protein [Elusimicrobiota bacterium]|nr:PilZ domain-containing protein [Elusimicrobiota bacterium]
MKLERRKYVRFPVMKDLAKQIELYFEPSETPMPAILLDLSAGGCSLLTFVPIEVGTKIQARIDLPGLKINNVKGKIIWTLNKENSWRIGIAFTEINKSDFEKIKNMSDDYADCEIKLSLGVTDVCFPECKFMPMCTKSVKLAQK